MRRIGQDSSTIGKVLAIPKNRREADSVFECWKGRIWVLLKLGDEPPNTHGVGYPIPVKIQNLPAYIGMIVDDHLLNYLSSDVMDVLTGKKSFQEALQFPSARAATHV